MPMVSSSSGSTANLRPSYAERAKKAQNIKSASSTRASRNPPQSSSTTASASAPPAANGGVISTPINARPFTSTTTTTEPSQAISANTPPSSTAVAPTPQTTNGSTIPTQDQPTKSSISATEPNPGSKVPPVNVWRRREEERAARTQAAQSTTSPQTRTSATTPPSLEIATTPQADVKDTKLSPNEPSPKSTTPAPAPAPNTNETERLTIPETHPVVITPARTPPTLNHLPSTLIPPTAVNNSDDWPTVGQAATQAASSTSGVNSTPPDQQPQTDLEQPVGTPKKSEKPKWVLIPPAEIQAVVDANRNTDRQHSRKGSQHAYQPNSSRMNHFNSSRAPSRNHSGRNSASHSVVQSRVNSRTASAQSSPQLPRGKRLPADDSTTTLVGGPYSHKSSGRNSPHMQSYSHRTPPTPVEHGLMTNMPMYSVSAVPAPNGTTYYNQVPPLHQPLLPPDQFPHSPHSPLHPPVTMYHAPGNTSPSQQYPGVHPYTMYAPYVPYDYSPQRYPPWSGSVEASPEGHYPPGAHAPYSTIPQLPPILHDVPSSATQADGQNIPMLSIQSTPEEGQPTRSDAAEKHDQPVLFGTIEVSDTSKSPSPTPQISRSTSTGSDTETLRKMFTGFSVGIGPDETTPRSKARQRPSKSKLISTTPTSNDNVAPDSNSTRGAERAKMANGENRQEPVDSAAKWEFGSTGQAAGPLEANPADKQEESGREDVTTDVGALPLSLQGLPIEPPTQLPPPGFGHMVPSGPPPHPPPPHMHMMPAHGLPPSGYVMPPAPYFDPSQTSDEWTPYGYGYPSGAPGAHNPPPMSHPYQVSASGSIAVSKSDSVRGDNDETNETPIASKTATDRREDRQRDDGISGGGGRGRRGYGYDRGYGGRRGRGMNNRGFGRGYRGGGYQHPPGPSGHPPPAQQRQPYTGTPPPIYQPLVVGELPGAFYPPPRQGGYMGMGYEGFSPMSPMIPPGAQYPPPVPVAPSPVAYGPPNSFTNTLLLKQLEYYLSPQNMAQDLFLRKRMDSRGWIPIPLVASFNRVKQLTQDVQLVRDVFMTSPLVEVRDDWVRTIGWEKYVLPDAQQSVVEPGFGLTGSMVATDAAAIDLGAAYTFPGTHPNADAYIGIGGDSSGEKMSGFDRPAQGRAGNGREGSDGEDDDEEEVEIVMGKETGLWTGGGGNIHTGPPPT